MRVPYSLESRSATPFAAHTNALCEPQQDQDDSCCGPDVAYPGSTRMSTVATPMIISVV